MKFDRNDFKIQYKKLESIIPGQKENDLSDKKHLAEAITAGIEYFITTDEGILNYAEKIFSQFGLLVYRPSEFILKIDEIINLTDYQPARFSGTKYDFRRIEAQELKEVSNSFLLQKKGEKKSAFQQVLRELVSNIVNAEVRVVCLKRHKSAVIGILKNEGKIILPLIRIRDIYFANTLFKQLLNYCVRMALKEGFSIIELTEQHLSDEHKSILKSFHFFEKSGGWYKYSYEGFFESSSFLEKTSKDHRLEKSDIQKLAEITSSESNLYTAERILFPIKFTDLDIPTFVIPIKAKWAMHLFDYYLAVEDLFGAKEELSWNRENIYYRSIKPNIETSPARILWYVSYDKKFSRTKGIVGCSYLDEIIIDNPKNLYGRFKKYGIYSWENVYKLSKNNIGNEIKAIKFSDSEIFDKKVSLKQIQKITDKQLTFQGPTKISSSQFRAIYCLGKGI